MLKRLGPSLVAAFWMMLASAYVSAAEIRSIKDSISEGKVSFNLRYRYEFVDQENFASDAGASTLLARIAFNSAPIGAWSYGVEADYVSIIGGETFNSTNNGETRFPVVADPEGFDLNQAFVRWSGAKTKATLGRQRINHPDQRFIGGVAWRQNEQTYDAAHVEFSPTEKLKIDYSYVWNVNRIFGPDDGAQPSDWRSNSHFVLAQLGLAEGHKLEAFTYLLDFENDNGIPNSNSTYGLTYRGNFGPLNVVGSYARQSDFADSPLDYDADYYWFQLGYKIQKVALRAGIEVLGSDDGVASFRTPLATLHKFNGFADLFLGTPAAGLEDTYVGLVAPLGPVNVNLSYHDFAANDGGADFGDEINLVATYKIRDNVTALFKFADYSADEFGVDTTKAWLMFNVKF